MCHKFALRYLSALICRQNTVVGVHHKRNPFGIVVKPTVQRGLLLGMCSKLVLRSIFALICRQNAVVGVHRVKSPTMDSTKTYSHCRAFRDVRLMPCFHGKCATKLLGVAHRTRLTNNSNLNLSRICHLILDTFCDVV